MEALPPTVTNLSLELNLILISAWQTKSTTKKFGFWLQNSLTTTSVPFLLQFASLHPHFRLFVEIELLYCLKLTLLLLLAERSWRRVSLDCRYFSCCYLLFTLLYSFLIHPRTSQMKRCLGTFCWVRSLAKAKGAIFQLTNLRLAVFHSFKVNSVLSPH